MTLCLNYALLVLDCPALKVVSQNTTSDPACITRWKPSTLLVNVFRLPIFEIWSYHKIVSDFIRTDQIQRMYVFKSSPECIWVGFFTPWTQIHTISASKIDVCSNKAEFFGERMSSEWFRRIDALEIGLSLGNLNGLSETRFAWNREPNHIYQ